MKKCHEVEALVGKKITRCGGHETSIKDYPEPLQIKDDKELIDCFEDRVHRWILKPAEILLETERDCGEEEPDVDFAVLAILNAVPEMLAQLQGYKDQGYEDEKLYEQGILYIFPALRNHTHKTKIVEKLLYGKLRSGIAHMGLTGMGILLERETEDPITPCYGRGNEVVVIVNVPKWYEQIKERVDGYISELRDPDPSKDALRQKFRKRMEASN